MTVNVNIRFVSLVVPECGVCVCVCVCVCVMLNQSTSKKPHYVPDFRKLGALLHKTHIKVLLVLRYQDWTCVDLYYH